jgi:YHS domain-containing protein
MDVRHGAVVLALFSLLTGGADRNRAADKQALAELQVFVGAWRGVGQPKRGSTAGAWTEEAEWAWHFTDDETALAFTSPNGKYLSAGRLLPGGQPGQFELVGTLPDGKTTESYRGALDEGRLVLEAVEPAEGRPRRITLRTVAEGDRLLVLYEAQRSGATSLVRLAEVGYTRKGSLFGKGGSGPECVVTGGYGSMSVEYMGKTYYVCCTGCRDLFLDDPEGVLAEYKERKAQEREQAAE